MALTEQELQQVEQPAEQESSLTTEQVMPQDLLIPAVQTSTPIPTIFNIDDGRRLIDLGMLISVLGKSNNINKFIDSLVRLKGRRLEVELLILTLIDELSLGKIKSRSAGKAYTASADTADPTGKRFDSRGLAYAYLDWVIDSLPNNFYIQPEATEKPKALTPYSVDDAFKEAFAAHYPTAYAWLGLDYDEAGKKYTSYTNRLNQTLKLLEYLEGKYANGSYDFSNTIFGSEQGYKNKIAKVKSEIAKLQDPKQQGDIELVLHELSPLMGSSFDPLELYRLENATSSDTNQSFIEQQRAANARKTAKDNAINELIGFHWATDGGSPGEGDVAYQQFVNGVKYNNQYNSDYSIDATFDPNLALTKDSENYGVMHRGKVHTNGKPRLEENVKSYVQRLRRALDPSQSYKAEYAVNNPRIMALLIAYLFLTDTAEGSKRTEGWGKAWNASGTQLWAEQLANFDTGLFWVYDTKNKTFTIKTVKDAPEEVKAKVAARFKEKYNEKLKGEYSKLSDEELGLKRNGGVLNKLKTLRDGGILKMEEGYTLEASNERKDWRKARAADPMVKDSVGVLIADGTALVADLTSLALSFTNATGYGALASGATGAVGSLTSFGADWARDGLQWADARKLGINLGLDVVGMLPGLGTGAKARKLAKVLPYFIGALGLSNLGSEGRKVVHKLEQSNWDFGVLDASDYLNLAQSIAVLIPGGKRVYENIMGSKYLNKIDADPIKALEKLNKTQTDKAEAIKELEKLNKLKRPNKQHKEKIAELETFIKNANAASLDPTSAAARGVERYAKQAAKKVKTGNASNEALETLYGKPAQEVVETAGKNSGKLLHWWEKRKMREGLLKKAGSDYSDVVELWEKNSGKIEDLDELVSTIAAQEGKHSVAFSQVKDLLSKNNAPEHIMELFKTMYKKQGGKIQQLKLLRKGGVHKMETGDAVQLPEVTIQGKRKPMDLGIKPVEASPIPTRINAKYPIQLQTPTYDGGMLPEVVINGKLPTYDGGELPEVVVNGKQPTYEGGQLPEVVINGTKQNDVAWDVNLPEIVVNGKQPIYDGGILPEVNITADNTIDGGQLPEVVVEGKRNPLKELKMAGIPAGTKASVDANKINNPIKNNFDYELLLPEVVINGQRTYDGGQLPEVTVNGNQHTYDGGVLPEVLVEAERPKTYEGGELPEVVINGQRPTYEGGMLPEVTVNGKRNTVRSLFNFRRNRQGNNQLATYDGGMLPEVTITGEKKSYLKRGGILKATKGASTEDIIGLDYSVSDTYEKFKKLAAEQGIDISNLTADNFTQSQAYLDLLTNNPVLAQLARTNDTGDDAAWSSELFNTDIVAEYTGNKTTDGNSVEGNTEGGGSGNGDGSGDGNDKIVRGNTRKPVPTTGNDDVLYGNKFKQVSPLWDIGQLANTITGINRLKDLQIQNVRDNIYLPSNQIIQKPIFRSGYDEAQEYERLLELNYNIMSQNQTTDAVTNKMAMLAAMSLNNNLAIQRNALINKITDLSALDIYEANLKQDALNYETAQERLKNLLAANKAIGDFEATAMSGISDAVNKAFVQGKMDQQLRVTDFNSALKGVLDNTNATEYSDQLRELAAVRDKAIAEANGDPTKIKAALDAYTAAAQEALKNQERKLLLQQASLYRGLKVPGLNTSGLDVSGVNPTPGITDPKTTEVVTNPVTTTTTDPAKVTVDPETTVTGGTDLSISPEEDGAFDILQLLYQYDPYKLNSSGLIAKNGGKLDKKEAERLRFVSKQLESQARSRDKGLDRLSKVTYKAILKSLGLK